MKWFKKKSKSLSPDEGAQQCSFRPMPYATPPRSDLIDRLSPPILERIFSLVCPHTTDETYESCEQSATEDSCPLCDLRDLAHCAQASKRWRRLATNVMYHSIRIDAVHYCAREDILAEARKRGSFLNRNAEPEDTPKARLRLVCRTLRESSQGLALHVQFLKLPYMTRENSKPDLARTVAVLPNLRYVDLPDGIFTDDQHCHALKHEIQARCPDLRKMTYMGGSERSLEQLASGMLWRHLEVLELTRLNMDPTILRHALGALRHLRALKITDMESFFDYLFQDSPQLPPFPPLVELIFKNVPNLTADGLVDYLSRPDTQGSLQTLSLEKTGVVPWTLQQVLASAPNLAYLTIIETVTTSFPATSQSTLLNSNSLLTLNYEITAASSVNAYSNTVQSYYTYLTSSLMSNGLPSLRALYVRDPTFPESLLDLPLPAPAYASGPDNFAPDPFAAKHVSLPPNKSRFASPPSPGQPFTPNSTSFPSHHPQSQPHSHSHSHSHSGHGNPQTLSPFASPFSSPKNNIANRSSSNNNPFLSPPPSGTMPSHLPGLKQPLEVYSKGLDEMEWNFARVQPPAPGRRGSATVPRPISSYGLSENMGKAWTQGQGARKSVVVGNGFGGFLAVPADEGVAGAGGRRPSSSAGEKGLRGNYDMWR
ncbi:hypothetical protein B7494_g2233 [Chlorociboria aeruginascens]|nr:hypothetical protein B7494_g2233 [Chlorociboria aeruginascens]